MRLIHVDRGETEMAAMYSALHVIGAVILFFRDP